MVLFALVISMNIFMYVGMNYVFADSPADARGLKLQDDFLTQYLQDKSVLDDDLQFYTNSLRNGTEISKSVDFSINPEWASVPPEEAGQPISPGENTFAFFDPIRISFQFIKTFFNVVIVPITLLSSSVFPPLINLLFGIPLAALNMAAWIGLLRGVSP